MCWRGWGGAESSAPGGDVKRRDTHHWAFKYKDFSEGRYWYGGRFTSQTPPGKVRSWGLLRISPPQEGMLLI